MSFRKLGTMFTQMDLSGNTKTLWKGLGPLLGDIANLQGTSLVLFLLSLLSLGLAIAVAVLIFHGRQALEEAQDRWSGLTLRNITNTLPSRICYIDRAAVLRYSNSQGYEQFYGQAMAVILHPDAKNEFAELFQNCLRGNVVTVETLSIFDRSRLEQIRLVPHRGRKDNIYGVICVTTDVSDYRAIEKELSSAKEAADSANTAKSNFLANMSHEIRTPLGAVLGFADLLGRSEITAVEKELYVDAIKRNGSLLKTLIDDILDLSKIEAGKMTIEKQTIKMSDILSDILSHHTLQAAQNRTQLVLNPSANLPLEIVSDPTRLRQVLINIIGNAVKFTEGGRVEVMLERLSSSRLIAIHVKDNGCGISDGHAQQLFNPFYQGDNATTRHYGGTGLGLVLARRFARLLGGDVVLSHSCLGGGCTFTITIDPEGQVSQSISMPVSDEELAFIQDPFLLKDVSILVVEDAPDNQFLISTYLKAVGAHYEIANNGLEALNKIERSGFDIVVMDIQMPIMDGFETAEELRLRGYEIPLIALTAHSMREEREKCLARGFIEHLSKPINPRLLVLTIRKLVTEHRQLREVLGRDKRQEKKPLLNEIPNPKDPNYLP